MPYSWNHFIFLTSFLSFPFYLPAQQSIQNTLDSITDLAVKEYSVGHIEKSFELMELVLNKARKNYAPKDSLLADILKNHGFIARIFGKEKIAEQSYLEAASIYEHVFGQESLKLAFAYSNLALLYTEMGKFKIAEKMHLTSAETVKKKLGSKHPTYATTLNNIGSFYDDINRKEDATYYYKLAMKIRAEVLGKEDYEYGTSLNNLGLLYADLGDNELAVPLLQEALSIFKITLGEEHPTYSIALNNLSTIKINLGHYDAAEKLMQEVINLRERTLGKKHKLYGQALVNKAVILEKKGDLTAAQQYYQAAEDCYKSSLDHTDPVFIILRSNRAWCYGLAGDYDKAITLATSVLDIQKKIYGSTHPDAILSLKNISFYYIKQNNIDSATHYLIRSIEKNGQIKIPTTKLEESWIHSLPDITYIASDIALNQFDLLFLIAQAEYQQTNDKFWLKLQFIITEAAQKFLKKKSQNIKKSTDQLTLLNKNIYFTERNILGALSLKGPLYLDRVLNSFDANKSLVLNGVTQSQQAEVFGGLPDSLHNQILQYQQQTDLLKKELLLAYNEAKKTELYSNLNNINQKYILLQKAIKKQYPKYYALRYATKEIYAKDIQQDLQPGTAFLEYFVGDSAIYLISILPNQTDLYTLDLSKKELHEKVKLFRTVLSDYTYIQKHPKETYKTYTETGYWLYEKLVLPALKDHKISNLIIISDGMIGHLPFESFLTEPSKMNGSQNYRTLPYLLNKYTISYNYAAMLWKENRVNSPSQNNGLILGIAASYGQATDTLAPNINRSSRLRNLRDQLQDLPAAKQEIEAIGKRFRGSFWQGENSNEANFKKEAANYAIIHLAMHGLLNERAPILSALAFTENGDSIENNFLEAWEISNMKLHAELVVLSACETGYGKFQQGEGIMSLARSFMYAGVPSLVVSMWQVNDASTSLIMQDFYQNLAKGMDKAEALRQAKLSYLKKIDPENPIAAHPAFWAPFIQLGDSRPIKIATKGGQWSWYWIGLGFAVIAAVGGAAMALRKKEVA